MAKVNKITKEELEKATKVSQEYNGIMQAIGNIELQKQDFLLKASEIRSNVEDIKKELQEYHFLSVSCSRYKRKLFFDQFRRRL